MLYELILKVKKKNKMMNHEKSASDERPTLERLTFDFDTGQQWAESFRPIAYNKQRRNPEEPEW